MNFFKGSSGKKHNVTPTNNILNRLYKILTELHPNSDSRWNPLGVNVKAKMRNLYYAFSALDTEIRKDSSLEEEAIFVAEMGEKLISASARLTRYCTSGMSNSFAEEIKELSDTADTLCASLEKILKAIVLRDIEWLQCINAAIESLPPSLQ